MHYRSVTMANYSTALPHRIVGFNYKYCDPIACIANDVDEKTY